jgi:hypothetical protein
MEPGGGSNGEVVIGQLRIRRGRPMSTPPEGDDKRAEGKRAKESHGEMARNEEGEMRDSRFHEEWDSQPAAGKRLAEMAQRECMLGTNCWSFGIDGPKRLEEKRSQLEEEEKVDRGISGYGSELGEWIIEDYSRNGEEKG